MIEKNIVHAASIFRQNQECYDYSHYVDRILSEMKQYYVNNLDKIRENCRTYYAENIEYIRKRHHVYRSDHVCKEYQATKTWTSYWKSK